MYKSYFVPEYMFVPSFNVALNEINQKGEKLLHVLVVPGGVLCVTESTEEN